MKVTINGTQQLIAKLQGLKNTRIKAAIRKGSRAACKVIQAAAVANMPVRRGVAKRSLKVRALPRSRTRVGTQLTSKVEGTAARHISFIELGTKRMAAREPIKRAVKQTRAAAGQAVIDAITRELEK